MSAKGIILAASGILALLGSSGEMAAKPARNFEGNMRAWFVTPKMTTDERECAQMLKEQREKDFNLRNAKLKQLPLKRLNGFSGQYFTDGAFIYNFYENEETGEFAMTRVQRQDEEPAKKPAFTLKRQGQKLVVRNSKAGATAATLNDLGERPVILLQNAAGKPVDVFTMITSDFIEEAPMFYYLHALLDGVWKLDGSKDVAVIGSPEEFINKKYGLYGGADPAACAFFAEEDGSMLYVCYAWGRVSRGDPAYRDSKMCGAGGAGSIQGPMILALEPASNGFNGSLLRDAKWVMKQPEFEKTFRLTKVDGQYGDRLAGLWPGVSTVPLSRAMLSLLPKNACQQMLNELKGKGSLTDTEKLNKSIIEAATGKKSATPAATKTPKKPGKKAKKRR